MLLEELKRRNVIRVATAYVVSAWIIVQVVETIFPFFGFSANAIRNVIIVLAIGFVPTVILAWVFQFTAEGLRRDTGEYQSDPRTTRALDRAIIAVLALGIVYFAIDKFLLAPERAAEREAEVAEQAVAAAQVGFYGDRSIAVLPFDNLSSDPEQVYFVDGVAEEILNLLARIRDLRVISRSSSFALRDQDLEIPEIAERLNVAHILEGSVRRAGNEVRVTAQLIEARTDTHLWSKTYEKELDDVFLIQDEIAADVARNLEIKLLEPLPHSRQTDPEVVALVQQVDQVFQVRDKDTGARMYALAKRAYDLDPDYPEAVAALSAAEWMRAHDGLVPWEEARPRWEALDARYGELMPESGYLEAAQAFELIRSGELEQAAALYLQSLEKSVANSELVRQAGRMALTLGRPDVAVRLFEHAVAIDPLCHQCRRMLTQGLLFRGEEGDYRRALEVREQFMAVAATGGRPYKSMLLMLLGEPEKVADVWAPINRPDQHQVLAYLAMADYSAGRLEEAQVKLARLEELLEQDSAAITGARNERDLAYSIAHVSAWFGDADKAFSYLMPAPKDISYYERLAAFDPMWREIHDDPRWLEYRAAIGMSPERLAAIEFDPWLPE